MDIVSINLEIYKQIMIIKIVISLINIILLICIQNLITNLHPIKPNKLRSEDNINLRDAVVNDVYVNPNWKNDHTIGNINGNFTTYAYT